MARTTIPPAVKYDLRKEVGFGCPVRNCGNPYLEYHHFDPPVSVRPHNEPGGMIALCPHHHAMADGGAFTVEQLHEMKANKVSAEKVKGNLEWLRNELLVFSGGNIYHQTHKVLCIDGIDVVSFNRDEQGNLALCVNMLSLSSEKRMIIRDNSWEEIGSPKDVRSPPQGKELEVSYHNGDRIYIRFSVVNSAPEAFEKYKVQGLLKKDRVKYPVTVLELEVDIAGSGIDILSKSGRMPNGSFSGGFTSHSYCAFRIENSGYRWGA
jgi:hypothetical protein